VIGVGYVAGDSKEQRRRGPGRPFQPGQSGNPSGMSKAAWEVKQAAQAEGLASIRKLVDLRDNAADEKVQRLAAVDLLERGFGKPAVTVEDTEGNKLAVGLVFLPMQDENADSDG
jgi:hypothetical protein